jgi:hypothetical protein
MPSMPSVKVGVHGEADPLNMVNTNTQNSISAGNGPPGYTLVRTAAYVTMHVVTYSYGGASRPLDVNWWPFTYPAFGIHWSFAPLDVGDVPVPLTAPESDGWVIWEKLTPRVDFLGVDANGNEQATILYDTRSGKSISKAMRRANDSESVPTLTLCWEWNDPLDLINRTDTFEQAYDLYASWAVKSWWEVTPGVFS